VSKELNKDQVSSFLDDAILFSLFIDSIFCYAWFATVLAQILHALVESAGSTTGNKPHKY
jgi:hypothetical protein